MTLHPRIYLQPATFSAMVLPFWLFMTRNLYVETGDVSSPPPLSSVCAGAGGVCGDGDTAPTW